ARLRTFYDRGGSMIGKSPLQFVSRAMIAPRKIRLSAAMFGLLAWMAVPALATVQINFSDDIGTAAGGFRISRSNPTGMSNVLDVGSDAAQTRSLNFLRVSSSTVNGGTTLD